MSAGCLLALERLSRQFRDFLSSFLCRQLFVSARCTLAEGSLLQGARLCGPSVPQLSAILIKPQLLYWHSFENIWLYMLLSSPHLSAHIIWFLLLSIKWYPYLAYRVSFGLSSFFLELNLFYFFLTSLHFHFFPLLFTFTFLFSCFWVCLLTKLFSSFFFTASLYLSYISFRGINRFYDP